MALNQDAPPPYPGNEINDDQYMALNKQNRIVYVGAEVTPENVNLYQSVNYPQTATIFGRRPVTVVCTQCHQQIVTAVHHEAGIFAWLLCLVLTIIGCIPCCVIPFCASSCKDVIHNCPRCGALLARYRVI